MEARQPSLKATRMLQEMDDQARDLLSFLEELECKRSTHKLEICQEDSTTQAIRSSLEDRRQYYHRLNLIPTQAKAEPRRMSASQAQPNKPPTRIQKSQSFNQARVGSAENRGDSFSNRINLFQSKINRVSQNVQSMKAYGQRSPPGLPPKPASKLDQGTARSLSVSAPMDPYDPTKTTTTRTRTNNVSPKNVPVKRGVSFSESKPEIIHNEEITYNYNGDYNFSHEVSYEKSKSPSPEPNRPVLYEQDCEYQEFSQDSGNLSSNNLSVNTSSNSDDEVRPQVEQKKLVGCGITSPDAEVDNDADAYPNLDIDLDGVLDGMPARPNQISNMHSEQKPSITQIDDLPSPPKCLLTDETANDSGYFLAKQAASPDVQVRLDSSRETPTYVSSKMVEFASSGVDVSKLPRRHRSIRNLGKSEEKIIQL